MTFRQKKLYLLLILVVLLGGLALVLSLRNHKSTLEQNFHIEDTSSIHKIFIADKQNNKVLLEKVGKDTSSWLVDGAYDANMPLVSLLIETLGNMRIACPVSKSSLPTVLKNLSAAAIKVEVYQEVYRINLFEKIKLFPHQKLTKTYYVGTETQDNMGTYMLLKGEENPYIIAIPGFRGFLVPRFDTRSKSWISRKLFDYTIRDIKDIHVEVPNNTQESFQISIRGNDLNFRLLSSAQEHLAFDTLRMSQFLSSFSNVSFDEFCSMIPSIQKDSIFTKNPNFILTVTDTANRTKQIKTYVKLQTQNIPTESFDLGSFEGIIDVDRMYAIVDNKDTVLVQYFIFDNLLKEASYFIGSKQAKK